MNYPIWEVPLLSGGLLIAAVAVVHVFVSHFAVGGGLFLVLTEMKGYREGDQRIVDYVRSHALFLVLLTLVFGAVTGVGIWFTIGLVQPSGTSTLIHTFVWAWAIEWVFFAVEIAAAFIYLYAWDRLDRRAHLTVGWIYFGAAWISLFIITGILSFMLTPGDWPETQDIKDGYFNPTFLPSVFIRTMGAIGLAGLYALVTASLLKEEDLRAKLVQYSARWLVPAFALLPIGVLWYFLNVPELARDLVMGATPLVLVFFLASAGLVAAIFGFAFLGSYVQPARFSFIAALFILALGLGVTGTSEWVREAVRKPFIIYDYMYSNSIRVDQAAQVKRDGVLATSKWSPIETVTEENELEAGKEVFTLLCSACHTEDGYNALQPIVEDWPESFIRQQIEQLEVLKPIMPPFLGNQEEGDALAAWLASLGGDGRGP